MRPDMGNPTPKGALSLQVAAHGPTRSWAFGGDQSASTTVRRGDHGVPVAANGRFQEQSQQSDSETGPAARAASGGAASEPNSAPRQRAEAEPRSEAGTAEPKSRTHAGGGPGGGSRGGGIGGTGMGLEPGGGSPGALFGGRGMLAILVLLQWWQTTTVLVSPVRDTETSIAALFWPSRPALFFRGRSSLRATTADPQGGLQPRPPSRRENPPAAGTSRQRPAQPRGGAAVRDR